MGQLKNSNRGSKPSVRRSNGSRSSARRRVSIGGTGAARLASPRDRSRQREREIRERARVERALASVPFDVEANADEASVARDKSASPMLELVSIPVACPVCAGTDVRCDEVMPGGRTPQLRLRECERCDFRWTERGATRFSEVGARMASSRPRRIARSA